ncbi:hypothetical protein C2G38_2157293 [Gigaspora rosea]|uniref:Uncharacterized protein n=1 Tax=Gigaspora rosea TaxID=44941 RepID=A0A397W393_9GLOM|nr:hypothetical protein C2G38_2157293 [Gigaspora rosea]
MLACKTVNLFYGWEGGNALTSPNLSWNGLEEIFHVDGRIKKKNTTLTFWILERKALAGEFCKNFTDFTKMVNANEWLNKKIPAEQREQVTTVHTPPEGKMSPFSISHYGFGVAGSTEGELDLNDFVNLNVYVSKIKELNMKFCIATALMHAKQFERCKNKLPEVLTIEEIQNILGNTVEINEMEAQLNKLTLENKIL